MIFDLFDDSDVVVDVLENAVKDVPESSVVVIDEIENSVVIIDVIVDAVMVLYELEGAVVVVDVFGEDAKQGHRGVVLGLA